jgi:hypothetical protein
MLGRFVAVMVASVAMAFAGDADAATYAAAIEIAPPPAVYGTSASALREIAAAELRSSDALTGTKRRVVVSLAVAIPKTNEPNECEVDATIRDAKTGAVLAVVDATLRSTRPLSRDERRALAHAAVRSAARRVTTAKVPDR